MTNCKTGDMVATSKPDPFHAWERLKTMRMVSGPRPSDLQDHRCALDLFPWWMLLIHNPGRAHATASHLGSLLCRHLAGFSVAGERFRRAFDILSCTVPVGSPAQISDALHAAFVRCTGEHADADGAITALRGLAHLEFAHGLHPGRFLAAISGVAMDSDAPLIAALHLVGTYEREDAVEWVASVCRNCKNSVAVTTAAGVLAKLGGGREALAREAAIATQPKSVVVAVHQALESGEYDALDPMFSDPQSWEWRNAAVRLLGNLVEGGAPAVPALEILLQRYRDDDDSDNRSVIAISIGKVLRRIGDPKVLQLLLEEKVAREEELLDGILFSGIQIPETLLPLLPKKPSRRGAVNRLLTRDAGLPPALNDWAGSHALITAMQWEGFVPPQPVRAWFEDAGSVSGPELVQAIHDQEFSSHDGSLAAAYLRAHPDVVPIFERLRVVRQNFGHQNSWELYSAVLAGAWVSVPTEPAELRCALGSHAGPPPEPSPRTIGRLLAVASSALPASREAMRLLSSMGDATREISLECLATLPAGIRELNCQQSVPADEGLGVQGHRDSGLGMPCNRLIHPASMPSPWSVVFGQIPGNWRSCSVLQADGLILAAHGRADWFTQIRNWSDAAEVGAFVQSLSVETVCRVLHAILRGPNQAMRPVAAALSKALSPDSVPQSLRRLLNLEEAAASSAPDDEDAFDIDIEEILRG